MLTKAQETVSQNRREVCLNSILDAQHSRFQTLSDSNSVLAGETFLAVEVSKNQLGD